MQQVRLSSKRYRGRVCGGAHKIRYDRRSDQRGRCLIDKITVEVALLVEAERGASLKLARK